MMSAIGTNPPNPFPGTCRELIWRQLVSLVIPLCGDLWKTLRKATPLRKEVRLQGFGLLPTRAFRAALSI